MKYRIKKGTNAIGCLFLSPFLMGVAIFPIIGIVLAIVGINSKIKMNKETQDYVETVGYYKNSTYITKNDEGTPLYKLNYEYVAYGENYIVSTNYLTNIIPKVGEEETIKYNSRNPNEAVITSKTEYGIMIFVGVMFVIIPFSWILPMTIGAIISKLKNRKIAKKEKREYPKSEQNNILTVKKAKDNDDDNPIKDL